MWLLNTRSHYWQAGASRIHDTQRKIVHQISHLCYWLSQLDRGFASLSVLMMMYLMSLLMSLPRGPKSFCQSNCAETQAEWKIISSILLRYYDISLACLSREEACLISHSHCHKQGGMAVHLFKDMTKPRTKPSFRGYARNFISSSQFLCGKATIATHTHAPHHGHGG